MSVLLPERGADYCVNLAMRKRVIELLKHRSSSASYEGGLVYMRWTVATSSVLDVVRLWVLG